MLKYFMQKKKKKKKKEVENQVMKSTSVLKASLRKVTIRTSMFLVYIFIGSGLFMFLEKKGETEKQKIRDYWLKTKLEFETNIRNKNGTNVTNLIEDFVNNVVRSVERGYYEEYKYLNWNFTNAFIFCANVITTIGYGHITPKSDAGRIVMMFYALFGIPLTGFFLRTVGNEMTNLISYLVTLYERKMFNREAEKLEMKRALVACFLAMIMLFFGGLGFSLREDTWSYLDGFYFCFVSLTTIGFGDFVPGQTNQNENLHELYHLLIEIASLVYYVLGLSIMSSVIVSISGVIEEKTRKLDITDPMDAIRNLRIENLNSKAMKKLGYKVDEGLPLSHDNFPTANGNQNYPNLATRRGTIVPDTGLPPTVRRPSNVPRLSVGNQQYGYLNKGYDNTDNSHIKHSISSPNVYELRKSSSKFTLNVNVDVSPNHSNKNNNNNTVYFSDNTLEAGDEVDDNKNQTSNNVNTKTVTNVSYKSEVKLEPCIEEETGSELIRNGFHNGTNKYSENKSIDKHNLSNNINNVKDDSNFPKLHYSNNIQNHYNNNLRNVKKKNSFNKNTNNRNEKIMRKSYTTQSIKRVGLPSELFASSNSTYRDTPPKQAPRRASSAELLSSSVLTNICKQDANNKTKMKKKKSLSSMKSSSLDIPSYDYLYNHDTTDRPKTSEAVS